MKYCRHCGKEIMDEAVICVSCGCSVQASDIPGAVDQSVNGGLVVLSVLLPLFGFIYWLVKAKTAPKCAKACGIAALISFAVSFFFYFILVAAANA